MKDVHVGVQFCVVIGVPPLHPLGVDEVIARVCFPLELQSFHAE